MSLRTGTIIKKKPNVLEKPSPKNPRYAHVQSTLDTGMTAQKQMDLRDEDPDHPTTGELFKRIRAGTLTRLIFEEDEIFDPSLGAGTEFIETVYDKEPQQEDTEDPVEKYRTRQLSGAAASELITSQYSRDGASSSSSASPYSTSTSTPLPASTNSKFLLLDVRTDDLYNQCHIRYGFIFQF